MSIFSSCVAAPYSGVITYKLASLWSRISVSLCPMPEVSRIMRSNPATFKMSNAFCTWALRAKFAWRVAKERINTLPCLMAFIRMRSPNKAPPVFLFEGSTDTTAMRLSVKSMVKRRTSSSTIELFPAPPVPVIPRIGVLIVSALAVISSISFACCSPQFSAALIHRAMVAWSASARASILPGTSSPTKKSDFSTRSLIIPCKPIFRPSSG